MTEPGTGTGELGSTWTGLLARQQEVEIGRPLDQSHDLREWIRSQLTVVEGRHRRMRLGGFGSLGPELGPSTGLDPYRSSCIISSW